MICRHCGNEIDGRNPFCRHCGNSVEQQSGGILNPVQDNNGGFANQQQPFGNAQNPFASPQPSGDPFAYPVNNGTSNAYGNDAVQYNSNPFGQQPENPENAVPFGHSTNNETWDPEKDTKKAKNKKQKAKKEKQTKGSGSNTGKIVFMVILQILFIGAIAYLALGGKFNNDVGQINIGLTVAAFALVIALDTLLFFLLFPGKSKKSELAPPPVFTYNDRSNEEPKYMSAPSVQENNSPFGGADVQNEMANNVPLFTPQPQPEVASVPEMPEMPATPIMPVMQAAQPEVTGDEMYPATEVMGAEELVQTKTAVLIYTEDGVERQAQINKSEFVIGRQKDKVDLAVSNAKIGRIHAKIVMHDGEYFAVDLNSKNKTYINKGEALVPEQQYKLFDNDVISLAGSEYVFRLF